MIVLLLRQLRNVRAYNEKNSGTNLHILRSLFHMSFLGYKYESQMSLFIENGLIRTRLILYILVFYTIELIRKNNVHFLMK